MQAFLAYLTLLPKANEFDQSIAHSSALISVYRW